MTIFINLGRFFHKFIPQDPNPWTQKNADPCGSGSATLFKSNNNSIAQVIIDESLLKFNCVVSTHENE